MKKIVLIALAVLISSMAFAQTKRSMSPLSREVATVTPAKDNPVWAHIGNPFTATDVYGDTVNLANILASGQSVLIDYSCTWCGPCWNMHNSGLLEAIDADPDIQVIWVEVETRNTTAQIFGPQGGSGYNDMTYGDWTVTADGDTIEYPIIDDDANRTCLATCGSLYEGYVPSIFLITPGGYFCSVYGETWGFGTSSTASDALTALHALIDAAPQAGTAPANVAINGSNTCVVGTSLSLNVSYLSVDEVTGISWTIQGGTPATANGENVTCTWNAAGTYTVSVTVTNTTGSTTATMDVEVVECHAQTLPFACGFESTDVLGCWLRYDLDGDGYNWDFDFWTGNSNYIHGGNSAVGSASYINNIGVLTPDQWLVSPELIIPSSGATLTFWIGGVGNFYNADTYSVYATANGDQPSDFTDEALFTETPTNASFTQKTVDLSAYAGQTIRLGFRHYNSEDGYWIIMDDVEVTANVGIDNAEMNGASIYPNPATSIVNVDAEGLQQVEVLDVNGRTVMTVNSNKVDMSNLSNGVYMFRVLTNNGVSMQKVIKK